MYLTGGNCSEVALVLKLLGRDLDRPLLTGGCYSEVVVKTCLTVPLNNNHMSTTTNNSPNLVQNVIFDLKSYLTLFESIQIRFWRYSKVFEGIQKYLKVFKSIWRYSKVFEGIWNYWEVFKFEGIWRYLKLLGGIQIWRYSNLKVFESIGRYLNSKVFEGIRGYSKVFEGIGRYSNSKVSNGIWIRIGKSNIFLKIRNTNIRFNSFIIVRAYIEPIAQLFSTRKANLIFFELKLTIFSIFCSINVCR